MKTEKELDKHESKYWHIRKSAILLLLLMFVFLFLSIVNFKFIISEWNRLKLSELECSGKDYLHIWNMIEIAYLIISEYLFISLTIIFLITNIKGKYKKLKKCSNEGLILGIIELIAGFCVGLVAGGFIGLIAMLVCVFSGSLICGLIYGLIAGLGFAVIIGLIIGVSKWR